VKVRVSDVEKWVGREESSVLEAPWPEALTERLDWPLVAMPTGTVTIRNTGESFWVEVEGDAVVTAPCSRCLAPFPLALHFHEGQEYRRTAPGAGSDGKVFTGDDITLDDLVTDAVLLAVPLAPVCQPTCRGLCDQCGANLNEGPCDCTPPTDLRWSALEHFRPARPEDH
jgi:uncharacterized protein